MRPGEREREVRKEVVQSAKVREPGEETREEELRGHQGVIDKDEEERRKQKKIVGGRKIKGVERGEAQRRTKNGWKTTIRNEK